MEELGHLFEDRENRFKLIDRINKEPEFFFKAVKTACANKEPDAWLATWILSHSIVKNDDRLRPFLKDLIGVLPKASDGHQREILKILYRFDLEEDQEGPLFDICMTIWESLGKTASARINAFRVLAKIVQKYPELKQELVFLTRDEYVDSLSHGVRHSFNKIWNKIK